MKSYIFYDGLVNSAIETSFNQAKVPYTLINLNECEQQELAMMLTDGHHLFIDTHRVDNQHRFTMILAFLIGYSYGSSKSLVLIGPQPHFITLHKSLKVVDDSNELEQYLDIVKLAPAKKKIISEQNLFEELLVATVIKGDYEKSLLLLNGYCRADSKDEKGDSALVLAIRYRHSHIVELLLSHGANCNVIGANGNSPLIEAAAVGDASLVSVLLKQGADPNSTNFQGQSALIMAVCSGNIEIVKELVGRANINIKQRDNLGMDALKYAELFGLTKIIPLLSN